LSVELFVELFVEPLSAVGDGRKLQKYLPLQFTAESTYFKLLALAALNSFPKSAH
jgi:hypothetical protein